ncbi:MAG: T9SS type A sorting domain-containing protein [Chitinophagales bacterium]|nr:T9SS type A sorting domain-containing protein [Chitinophagales bacterium]
MELPLTIKCALHINMPRIFKKLLLAAAIHFVAANFLYAQNYTLSPGDSIVANAQMEELTVFNILQNNNSIDSLFLEWEKISADVPAYWEASICDNNYCYTELKESGTMLPVVESEYGFLSIHLIPQTLSGTATIRYAVWETNKPLAADTLTWIITSELTGIENENSIHNQVWLSGRQLIIESGSSSNQILKLIDVQGRLLFEKQLSGTNSTIDLNHLPQGIFVVSLWGENSQLIQKIFLK